MAKDTFGARLRRLRDRAGLTQQQLADAAGLTNVHVCRLETGGRKAPTLPTLVALARALGVGVGELAGK